MQPGEQHPGPYPFTAADLPYDRLHHGITHTLDDYYAWRDGNPGIIADHIDHYTAQLDVVAAETSRGARLGRLIIPRQEQAFTRRQLMREIGYFSVYNMAEITDPHFADEAASAAMQPVMQAGKALRQLEKKPAEAGEAAAVLAAYMPELQGLPEIPWLYEQLNRLYRILPEETVRGGGMGKVLRTIGGVLLIGSYDTRQETPTVRRSHLSGLIAPAYAYGAAYAIVDDILQDSAYMPPKDRTAYHDTILRGLGEGYLGDTSQLPDHPLTEELERMYHMVLQRFPFKNNRTLYDAARSMHIAQDRDARLTLAEAQARGGVPGMYPDIFIKASMTRVIANIMGRRHLDDGFYARAVNIDCISQFRDDIADVEEDSAAGRLTPFTYPPHEAGTNPLYDAFAYDAYAAHNIFGNYPAAAEALTFFGASIIAARMPKGSAHIERLLQAYPATPELRRFLQATVPLSRVAIRQVIGLDKFARDHMGTIMSNRRQTDVDPRTFVSDRLDYINGVIDTHAQRFGKHEVGDIMRYSLEAGGKRLRPALTLMLAESLGQPRNAVEPLLTSVELFHTASLLFDDMPAQDNASLRRGRPTAHTAFNEGDAQVAGVAMISAGFGVLSELRAHYPADAITEVLGYVGKTLGPEGLCRGQSMDLHMKNTVGNTPDGEDIIKMYALKTSAMLEAALLPLMMLTGRPETESRSIQAYAYHAGIVFQLRDDILDATASASQLGKDTGADNGKINIVQAYGLEHATQLMEKHLCSAVANCQALPFNTQLLEGVVRHFATRRR